MNRNRMYDSRLYISCLLLILSVFVVVNGAEEQAPQLITTENNDYKGYLDEFKGFQCQAKGTNLKYSWKHNDVVIDEKYILKFPVTNSSTLKPLPANLDENYRGSYQCFVSNSIGRIFGRKAYVEFTIVGKFLDKGNGKPLMADVGKPFFIHCPRHSKSNNVQYNWFYMQANEPQPLPASNNSFVTKNGTLYFSVLREEDIKFIDDNGGILCRQTAYVKGSSIRAAQSHLIKLKKNLGSGGFVRRKPKIETIVSDHTIFTGSDSLVLKCGATGFPIPALKWYRIDSSTNAETEIIDGADFKLQRYNQLLTIKNVGSDKAGKYKCKAKNDMGEDAASGRVKVAELPQWRSDGELGNVEPALYSRLEWECGAFGGPSYDWYKNGVRVPARSPDGKVVVQSRGPTSYLVITNVTEAFNGMYQCTAANELDTIYSTGRLHVKEKAPEFTERMGPVTLIRSTTGLIICPVTASPRPVITWRKNGQIIFRSGPDDALNNKRFKIDGNGGLLIPNVTNADRGVYLCHAKNRKGSAEDQSVATVGADISWKNAPVDNRNVTITLRYELDCEAEGDPSYEIKYRWLRNGLPLEYTARIHWVKDEHRLVILDALVSDTGTYTCIAFAETPLYIEKRKDVDIVVKAPADPPDIVRVKGSCWTETATLEWKVGSLNNEVPYEYWIDWASSYNPTNWTRLAKVMHGSDNFKTNLDFKLLPPFSQISFRVSVFNRIGAGKPSTPTDPSLCITKPAAPPFSPTKIEGVPGKANVLKLMWTPVPQTFWGAPGFNYSVQWRRKTRDVREDRWLNLPVSQDIRIFNGNNNSVEVQNPGYYNLWEFRIRSNNMKGSAKDWTYGESYSGQDPPKEKPTGLTPDRVTARSADISWRRITAPNNGSIDGYRIKYWHSGRGQVVEYDKNANLSQRAKRDIESRTVRLSRSRDLEARNVARTRTKREDEDEDVEKEDPYDICFNPDDPCSQDALERESQLKELRPYREYHVRIAAFNSGGEGPWSLELIFATAEAPPGPPYAVNTYPYDKYCKLTWKEPRHKNGIILEYEIYGQHIVRQNVPWWMRRHIIYNLETNKKYEAKIRARTATGWGSPVFRWFQTHPNTTKPAKPLIPEVVGYGEDGVNVTFMEPKPKTLRKFGGEIDEDPWEYRPVGGYEMENLGVGGYPERFYVVYRRKDTNDKLSRTKMKQMYGLRDQTWIVIENLQKDTVYVFATVPVNSLGEGPRSDWAKALTGGIIPRVEKIHWYQRDWFIALVVLFAAALLLLFTIVLATLHIKSIYYEGAPKRRKDREREKIYEPEDVDGGFNEFTLKSARSSRSVVTSRSEAPPPYNSVVGSLSRHSGDFDDEEDATDSDDEKNEVSTYYSDEKKVPLDDLDDDDEEDSRLATFV